MHLNGFISGLAALGMPLLASARFVPDVPRATPVADHVKRQTPTASTLQPPAFTLSEDPWQCVTENIPRYFEVLPQPTGSVLSALQSFGDDFAAPCMATAADPFSCLISNPKDWCGYTTAAPPAVLADYSSTYLPAAVSFWTENSATLAILSTSCPVAWWKPSDVEHEWLRIAKAHAECYLQSHPQTRTESGTGAQQSASTHSMDTTSSSIPTTTSDNASNTKQILEGFALMSTGLAILANAA